METQSTLVAEADLVRFFKALADETRMQIVNLLALSDLRAGEIVQRVRLPQNAVSYHLKQLRAANVVRDRRSSADARDIYYSIDQERLHMLYMAAGDALHTRQSAPDTSTLPDDALPLRILYLCTHNSARSQLAEAITRQLGGQQVEVYSAGNQPTQLHPITVEILESLGLDPDDYQSKSMEQFADQTFDYVITVCDRARESCPTFPGDPVQIHWSFSDPSQIADPFEQRRAFQHIRREIETRIRYVLNLPHPVTKHRIQLPLRTAAQQQTESER